ncbi:MAG: alpha/beta hydrolase, partial [Burkholderiales bacterium]|nr:alpha/beta hydrolase [Burkholderiales bacterium]
ADWPRGAVPAAFFTIAPAPVPVLLLAGGDDPATPPRHAEAAARALGSRARLVVVAHAGHGMLGLDCLRDAAFRFVDAASDAAALAVETGCARDVPRPGAFDPVHAADAP